MADHDLAIISSLVIFLTVLIYLNGLLPSNYQFISGFTIGSFVASVLSVSAFCGITTGIPCAIALGFSALLNGVSALLSALGIISVPILSDLVMNTDYTWIGSLILNPISVILSLYIYKQARGT